MNMTQMKYFITAAKCLNFTKAADKLFITQPALSRQIAAMEMELNMQDQPLRKTDATSRCIAGRI